MIGSASHPPFQGGTAGREANNRGKRRLKRGAHPLKCPLEISPGLGSGDFEPWKSPDMLKDTVNS